MGNPDACVSCVGVVGKFTDISTCVYSESFPGSGWSLEIQYRHDDGLTDNHMLLCYG